MCQGHRVYEQRIVVMPGSWGDRRGEGRVLGRTSAVPTPFWATRIRPLTLYEQAGWRDCP